MRTHNELALDVSNTFIQIQVGDDRISTADSADVSVLVAVGVDAFAAVGEVPVRAQIRRGDGEEERKRDENQHILHRISHRFSSSGLYDRGEWEL